MDVSRVERISSLQNPMLKSIRRAIQKGSETEEGCLVAEGFHLLEEALTSGMEIVAVIGTAQGLAGVGSLGARVIELTDSMFRDLSGMETPQGIMALVRTPKWDRKVLLEGTPMIVALDSVQDPGNAGTILRSAEAFGATAVLLLRGTVDFANPKVLRASAGSVFRVPVFRGELSELSGVKLFGADGDGAKVASEVDWRGPCAIVIGSEGQGLCEASKKATQAVRIPTQGVESLNAAIAAAVFLYEAARQRGGGA
jgi:TrmH family RNA methyltransferase